MLLPEPISIVTETGVLVVETALSDELYHIIGAMINMRKNIKQTTIILYPFFITITIVSKIIINTDISSILLLIISN